MTQSAAGPAASTEHTTGAGQPSTTLASAGAPITVVAPEGSGTGGSSATDVSTEPAPPSSAIASDSATTESGQPSGGSTTAEPTVVETTVTAPNLGPTHVPVGTVVVIDAGHNGGNSQHPEIINKKVSAGFGLTKACNTTGTATNAGYSEHAFNWAVAIALKSLLEESGVPVVMTRDSDTGVGPCIDKRAAIGNDAHAAAVISIHGDGEAAAVHGFFVMTSSHEPGGPNVSEQTNLLASSVRDGLERNDFQISNTIGKNGLWARGDLGGLNLSLVPSVMIELGNMRNASDAKTMSSPQGQQRYAEGIASGVLAFLAGHQAG